MTTTVIITPSIICIIGLIVYIYRFRKSNRVEKFEKPRSLKSEYSLEHNEHIFVVKRVLDKNHVFAKYQYSTSLYVVITGKFCEMAEIEYKNPIIIGRYYNRQDDEYFPIVAEGELK